MKKLIVLLILLIATPVWAVNISTFCGGGVAATSSCDPASNEVGDRADYTAAQLDLTSCFCLLYTPDCSGTLGHAFISHHGTGADNVKIGVFLDDGNGTPGAGDTLVGSWVVISSSADTATGYATSSSEVGGTVSTSSTYWVCANPDTTNWYVHRTTSGSRTAYNQTVDYASPPGTLTGTWSSTASRDYMMYVEVQ